VTRGTLTITDAMQLVFVALHSFLRDTFAVSGMQIGCVPLDRTRLRVTFISPGGHLRMSCRVAVEPDTTPLVTPSTIRAVDQDGRVCIYSYDEAATAAAREAERCDP